jgi:outer membrane biosynthesis protein TonB
MSAHYSAPGLRRAQLATPSFRVRRRALFVAAATLCAPALAAIALAALAATGGGNQPAMGSLAGTEGLRGTTSPVVNAPPPATSHKDNMRTKTSRTSDSPDHQVQRHPAPKVATPAPSHQPVSKPPHQTAPAPTPHLNSPIVAPYDPSQPGAPSSSSTTPTGGSSGSGTTTTSSGSDSSSHGSSGYPSDGVDPYSGGD